MIYTSYFGNIKKILAAMPDARFISIAGKTPDWFDGKKFKALAPHYCWWKIWHKTFASNLDSKESIAWYTDMYNKTVLRDLNPLEIAQQLKDLADWHTTVILCYETPEKFCHRHLVSSWLNSFRVLSEEWKESTSK